jgi:DNA-binding NarL/FixJ family response regulator
MNVLLVDDHPIVQEILSAIVRKAFAGATVHVAKNFAEALAIARGSESLELVLLDLVLPDCAGIDALFRLRPLLGRTPVLVISALEGRDTVLAALEAGAAGYVCKTSSPQVIDAAVRAVLAGGTYIPPQAVGSPADAAVKNQYAREPELTCGLTERQFEVLRMVAAGFANRDIARRLSISESTVKQHLESVYLKFGVSSRTQAINAAERRGINLK